MLVKRNPFWRIKTSTGTRPGLIWPLLRSRITLPLTLGMSLSLAPSAPSLDQIPTETPMLAGRLHQGGAQLLIDGGYSLLLDSLFYQAPVNPGYLFAQHPLNFRNLDLNPLSNANHSIYFRQNLGNEIGDPHLREVSGAPYKNHTPYLQSEIKYSVNPNLSFLVSGHQVDHFTYSTVGARSYLVKDPRSSWFGENLPTKSSLATGVYLKQPGYSLQAVVDKGWWWTASPYSGFVYPWKGYRTYTHAEFLKFFSLDYTQNRWNSISTWDKTGYWHTDDWQPQIQLEQSTRTLDFDFRAYVGFTYWNIIHTVT